MVRTIQRLKVTMQYHMEAVSEVSNECVQYMGLPLSHVLLTKWRKQLSHELPFYIQNSTQQTFFCLLWFLMLTKTLKLEYYVLDFSVWAHGPLAIDVSQNRSVQNITQLQPLKVVENNFWFWKNLLPFYRPENSRNICFQCFFEVCDMALHK